MTVYEYLVFAAKLKKLPKDSIKASISEVMELVKIQDVKGRLIRNLSKGYRQRVGMAQAILGKPDVIILDEPTRGIDIGTKIEIQKLVLKLAAEGMSVTFISSETDEMLHTCSRLIVMRDRKMVGELSGDDLNQVKIMETIAGGEMG